jgi:DNA-binding transcriptional MerR regulator
VDKAPDAFRTISEVAEDLDVPQHVLRFWETRFTQIKPMKRGGGRRYYRPDDVDLLRGIRHLLYGEGYTIRGVQRLLKDNGVRFVQAVWKSGAPQPEPPRVEDADHADDAPSLHPPRAEDAEPGRGSEASGSGDLVPANAPGDVAVEPKIEAKPKPTSWPRAFTTVPFASHPMGGGAPTKTEPERRTETPIVPAESPPGEPLPLAAADHGRLQVALAELIECRRLLDSALQSD